MPTGLGGEQLWLCPSLDDSASDISANATSVSYFNGLSTTADTTSGGTRAYDFDAGTVGVDCGDILDTEIWTTGNPFTLTGWAKVGSDGVVLLSKAADAGQTPVPSNNRQFFFQVRDLGSGLRPELTYYPNTLTSGSFRVYGSTTTVSVGTWYHFTAVYSGPTSTNVGPQFYINGVKVGGQLDATGGSDAAPMLNGAASVALGLNLEGANYGNVRGGRSDDIRVFDRVLTQAEIAHLASARGVEGGLPQGLGDEQLWISASNDNTGTSTAFNDQSGEGNDGTANGGMLVIADTNEGGTYAFDFDGATQYIGGNLSTALGTSVSSSCWIKFDASATTTETFISNNGFTSGGWLLQRKSDGKLRYAEDGDSLTFADNVYASSTSWHNIVSVKDNGTIKLYIDGEQLLVTSSNATHSMTKTAYSIGRRDDSASQHSACVMDDIRFYNRALAQDEITHLARARGIEGPAPVGLGTEKIWLSPTVVNNVSPFDDLSPVANTMSANGGLLTVADSGSGGSYAYDFDRAAAKAVLQDAAEVIDDTDSFSVSWWMNPSVLTNSNNYFIADCRSRTGGSYLGWTLYLRPQSGALHLGTVIKRGTGGGSNTGLTIDSSAVNRLNVWTHCTCNWDNTTNTFTLFVDGVNAGTFLTAVSGGPAVPAGTHIAVGNYSPAPDAVYPPIGMIDDFRVHNRVLTQAEAAHLATSRGILGGLSTPTTGFYNPFINKIFNNDYTRRIR